MVSFGFSAADLYLDSKREGCVEERLRLQLGDGDGDAEPGGHPGVEESLGGASEGAMPAGACLNSHAWPAPDVLWGPLPSRHQVCGKGKFGREEKDEDRGEGGGDHAVQGLEVQ